jgi:cytochrome d ubiquinol oxidase subunit II
VLVAGFGLFAIIVRSGASPYLNVGIAAVIFGVVALVGCYFAFRSNRQGWALGLGIAAMAAVSAVIFTLLYPNVMISSTDPANSLTIYNAASSAKTLNIMSIVVLIFLPIVLAYQTYNYWVFRKRLTSKSSDLHY